MNNYLRTLVKNINNISSILDNIIFLDIETSGSDPEKSEILEVAAIKIRNSKIEIFNTLIKNKKEIPIEILSLCSGMCKDDFKKALDLEVANKELIDFVGNETIVCHNMESKKKFLNFYIKSLNNKVIDSMELAIILEPYHKEYSLDYLKKNLIKNSEDEKNRALSDAIDILNVVNALLIRHKKREEGTLEPLSFKLDSLLRKHNLPRWNWSYYIDNAEYDKDIKLDIFFDGENNNKKIHINKEKEVFNKIYTNGKSYEELLKDKDIWVSKEGFMYEYRPGQYELTKTIRETFKGNGGTAKIACIEAPTGIGKSVGYLLPAILEARLNSKRIIISTDTKELQTQLINKDIPNVINSLGLNKKVSYGYIKGKNNYICVERLEGYKADYKPEKPTVNDIISLFYIEQLTQDGKYGDIEEINYWVMVKYEEIINHLRQVSCDPNICRPKKCHRECLYKRRVEELKEEDITVVNHSLLAKWPYKDEKPIENIIVDEAHNLTEKGYDFFSCGIEYRSFKYLLQEIYPYENIRSSPFAYSKKIRKVKVFDKFYNHIRLEREAKDKISRNINLIIEEMNSILDYGNFSDYGDSLSFNLKWELNLQQEELLKEGLTYKNYSKKIKSSCENIIRNLSSVIFLIDRSMDDDSIDKESDIYKFGKSRFKDLEDIKNTLQIFMEYNEDDHIARIIEIDKNFNYFELKVTPLKLADLFEENILSQLNSGIFLSATLTVGSNMSYFKNTLGINRVDNIEKVIAPLYNYKKRVLVMRIDDICDYKNSNFSFEMSELISKLSQVTNGHMLSLFNSTERLNNTYNIAKDYLHNNDIEIYKNKNGIKYLKDINKKCVVLGSKGCFEGVDVPGDGLICVTLDKIPNLNPSEPLYYTIMKKYGKPYYQINYPQMVIKVKQAMGRILRSKYDYGCFIIFNTGTNYNTLKRLEKDLHGCNIISVNKHNVYKYIYNHFVYSRQEVLDIALGDIFSIASIDGSTDLKEVKSVVNKEMKNRNIKSEVYDINEKEKTFKIKYFDKKYLINKEQFLERFNK